MLITTVFAYLVGIISTRGLGSKVASFVALFEVLFAVIWAWILLGELPLLIQLLGGVFIMLGVVMVRLDELRGSSKRGGSYAVDLQKPLAAEAPQP